MKHIFIINPNAGSKAKDALIENIKSVFKENEYYLEITTRAKEATEIAKHYAKSGLEMCMYACGGDGTLHEVVNGIVGFKNVKLGVIPIGTGNDFVKSFKEQYTKEEFLSIENYLEADEMSCDIMAIENEYSMNTVSIGFDVGVAAGVNKYRKLPFGGNTVPYVMSLVENFARDLGFEFNVLLDGKALGKQDYSFVVCGNGKYYGGGFLPCPEAQLNDGYMDVCLIKKIKHIQIPQLIGSYKKGTHLKYSDLVNVQRVKKLQIIAKDKIEVCLDGEIRTYLNPIIELIPNAISLLLPKKKS